MNREDLIKKLRDPIASYQSQNNLEPTTNAKKLAVDAALNSLVDVIEIKEAPAAEVVDEPTTGEGSVTTLEGSGAPEKKSKK